MKALVFERNVPRFAAARVASLLASGKGAAIGPLRLVDAETPDLPAPDWAVVDPTLSGICGSDLATVDGRSSRYFEDIVSFPFVPGHEIVGTLRHSATDAQGRALGEGARVVVEPVLGCAPRALEPPCPWCDTGHTGNCTELSRGDLAPGLQTGYCHDTGGGWSAAGLVAHPSQLHAVPESLDDEAAVMVEPTACGVHAALAAEVPDGGTVAVLGAGTLGLTTVAGLAHVALEGREANLLVGAKHPHQRRLAESLGATAVTTPDQLPRAVRRATSSLTLGGRLSGGADVVLDCVGTSASLSACLAMVRPRGTVVAVGMPGAVKLDLAPLWHREIRLAGAYAYGVEPAAGGTRSFELAFRLVEQLDLGRLVSATYPIDRYEEALAHAGAVGPRGGVKIAFDLRTKRSARRPDRKGTRR